MYRNGKLSVRRPFRRNLEGARQWRSTQCQRTIALSALAVILSALSLPTQATATDPESGFEVCMSYVNAFQDLERKVENHRKVGAGIIADQEEALQSLKETRKTIDTLVGRKVTRALNAMQNHFEKSLRRAQLNDMLQEDWEVDLKYEIDVRYNPQSQFDYFASQLPKDKVNGIAKLTSDISQLGVAVDAAMHQLKTLQVAENLAVQRYQRVAAEIVRRIFEIRKWNHTSVQLFDEYWRLADIQSLRSDLEHRVVLRELDNSADDNLGVLFVRAISLMRLDRHEEARPLIDSLLKIPAIHARIQVLSAEWYAHAGMEKESALAMQQALALGKQDPRVRMHRAHVFAIRGEFEQAEREWGIVQRRGGSAVDAHRALALLKASYKSPTPGQKTESLKNATVAAQLSADDWSCVAAVALAAATNGDQDQAIQYAEKASALAVGSNQAYCEDLLARIQANHRVSWYFD